MNYAKIIIGASLLAQATVAAADGGAGDATVAYKRGQTAFKAGRIHEACDAYAESVKLDPKVEVETSLAACYEQDGKPVAAAKLYRELADKDGNAERRKTAAAKATKLEARAPKLRFAINPAPAGLVVKVDGIEVSATDDVMVDTGPHEVIATAPGYEGHASAPVDREKAIVDVIVRLQPKPEAPVSAAGAPVPSPAEAAATSSSAAGASGASGASGAAGSEAGAASGATSPMTDDGPADHRMRNGAILGGAGVAALVGATVMFVASSHKFDDEHALCPTSKCANQADLDHANSLLSDGHLLRGFSIGTGIAGGVLLIAGGYLMLTPHHAKEEARVSVHVEPGGAGLGYTAHF